ncbi:MAG: AAA family ATPase [Bdellovibrionales bacterium]|nr:AAA family ATPase [Bdellovibrionales bacterium]
MPKNKNVKELLDKHQIQYEMDSSENNYKLKICLFCGSSNSKLEVHATKGCFKCWVCDESGSFSKLQSKIRSQEHAGNTENLTEDPSKANKVVDLTKTALRLHSELKGNLDGEQFYRIRGINQDSIDYFKLGIEKRGSERWTSIPHFKDGVAVNIKYRSLPPLEKKWRQEKGTQKTLFNNDALKNSNEIILTEGEIKTIALHQVGIKNAVGLTGGVSNIPQTWIDQLREKERVILCLDSDQPGQDAALEIAKRVGVGKCFNIVLPDAKDPDEYFFDRRHTKSDFLKLMKAAKQFDLHQCFSGLQRAINILVEKISFLWDSRIPISKITMLDGNPGVGKSHLALAIVAAISRGEHPWPPVLDFEIDSHEVIVFCGEDGAADTIVPRLKMLKANLDHVHIYSKPIVFDEKGLIEIESMVAAQKPALLLFDPMTSFIGGRVDIHRANEVRERLSAVARIAEKHSCSVLIVRHLNKGGSKDHAIYRGLGSIDLLP